MVGRNEYPRRREIRLCGGGPGDWEGISPSDSRMGRTRTRSFYSLEDKVDPWAVSRAIMGVLGL